MAVCIITLIACTLSILYFAAIVYIDRQWRLLNESHSTVQSELLNFSILVPFRNESKHLRQCLESLLHQNYPAHKYEIICIDDHSSDSGPTIVASLANQSNQIKYFKCPEGTTGKKQAIHFGSLHAGYNYFITVDADIRVGPNWLATYNSLFQEHKAVAVAGPVLMHPEPMESFHYFQAIDYSTVQAISMVGFHNRWFFNASGANMAFTRDAYKKYLQQGHGQHLASGDDVFFLESSIRSNLGPVLFPKNKDLIALTSPENNWSDFISQRQRWASKSFHYHTKAMPIIWGFVWFNNVNILLLAFVALFTGLTMWFVWGGIVLIKIIADFILIRHVTNYFDKSYLKHYLLSQLYHIFYVIIIGILTLSTTSYQWKDKKISSSGKF